MEREQFLRRVVAPVVLLTAAGGASILTGTFIQEGHIDQYHADRTYRSFKQDQTDLKLDGARVSEPTGVLPIK